MHKEKKMKKKQQARTFYRMLTDWPINVQGKKMKNKMKKKMKKKNQQGPSIECLLTGQSMHKEKKMKKKMKKKQPARTFYRILTDWPNNAQEKKK